MAVPVRLIKTPKRGPDGLFVQPREVGPERELIEQHHRDFLAYSFDYADHTTGRARTFDPKGNYNCGACNRADDQKCMFVYGSKPGEPLVIDRDAGSCEKWEDLCAGDAEMYTNYASVDLAGYAIAKNGNGFGCHRCPFGSKAYEPDSQGRDVYCGKGDCRVNAMGCCELNGAEEVPLGEDGQPKKTAEAPKPGEPGGVRWGPAVHGAHVVAAKEPA